MKLRVEVLQSITFYSPSIEGEPRLSARAMQQSPHHSSNMTLFDTMYTQPYFDNTLEWFRAVAKGSPNYQVNAPPFLDEALFLKVITVLTMDDTGDDDILEIFDLLDRNNLGKIGFDEFFLIISLLAAKESGQCTKFLFLHGKAIFTLLSSPNAIFSSTSNELPPSPSTTRTSSSYVLQTPSSSSSSSLQQTPSPTPLSPTITFERFSRFGTLLGISEHQLIEILNEQFGNQISTSGGGLWLRYNDRKIDYDAFLMYYFALLDDFDQQKNPDRKQIFSEQPGLPTDEEEEEDEVSEIEEEAGSTKNIEHSSSQSDKSETTEASPNQNVEKAGGCCTIL